MKKIIVESIPYSGLEQGEVVELLETPAEIIPYVYDETELTDILKLFEDGGNLIGFVQRRVDGEFFGVIQVYKNEDDKFEYV